MFILIICGTRAAHPLARVSSRHIRAGLLRVPAPCCCGRPVLSLALQRSLLSFADLGPHDDALYYPQLPSACLDLNQIAGGRLRTDVTSLRLSQMIDT